MIDFLAWNENAWLDGAWDEDAWEPFTDEDFEQPKQGGGLAPIRWVPYIPVVDPRRRRKRRHADLLFIRP